MANDRTKLADLIAPAPGKQDDAAAPQSELSASQQQDSHQSYRTAADPTDSARHLDSSVGVVPNGQAQPGPSIPAVAAGSIEAVRARVSEETASIHRRFTHGLLR